MNFALQQSWIIQENKTKNKQNTTKKPKPRTAYSRAQCM